MLQGLHVALTVIDKKGLVEISRTEIIIVIISFSISINIYLLLTVYLCVCAFHRT